LNKRKLHFAEYKYKYIYFVDLAIIEYIKYRIKEEIIESSIQKIEERFIKVLYQIFINKDDETEFYSDLLLLYKENIWEALKRIKDSVTYDHEKYAVNSSPKKYLTPGSILQNSFRVTKLLSLKKSVKMMKIPSIRYPREGNNRRLTLYSNFKKSFLKSAFSNDSGSEKRTKDEGKLHKNPR
jgi:hypothetical protein